MTVRLFAFSSAPLALVLLAALAGTGTAAPPGAAPEAAAKAIFDTTGVEGGLVVHLGCGDGTLTSALAPQTSDDEQSGGRYLVQGLDTDARHVATARREIQSRGLYGKVSARRFDGRHLPYADETVNLLVAEDLGDVPRDEVLRVLVPGGMAYTKNGARLIRKPWPAEIDEWSHFLHDASNNAVADDSRVGPPRRLKWACGPLWLRNHEFNSSLCAMVSSGGRLFYIFDEGLTSLTDPPIPQRWTLIARDAFNGVLLWQRPMEAWGAGYWKSPALRSVPATVMRLLVAQDDRVFVTLGYGAAVSALDAATGEVVATYEDTEGAQEIRAVDGVLLVRKGKSRLMAIDPKSGKTLWEASGKIQSLSLAAADGKVCFGDGADVVCLNLADGRPLWRAGKGNEDKARRRPASLVVIDEDRVFLLRGTDLEALSAETGKTLWTAQAGIRRQELFVANHRLWHWEGDHVVGRDLDSGEVTARPNTDDVFTPGHHLRCYQSKATQDFLITPNRGVEFVSTTGAANTENDWVRGACRYGVMPSDGLLFVPPSPCFCYPGVKLTGFNALAAGRKSRVESPESSAEGCLEHGPAFDSVLDSRRSALDSSDWPTYRHDARRSGAADCRIAPGVSQRWRIRLGGSLTPPVASGDRVFVAAKNAHTLYALAVDDGHALWQFTADGRIDSPPTVFGGLVLFGCADGSVYCLRAADGELAWRFHAAPSEEQIVAFDQLESPWRVHGSVLVLDGLVYFTAGRSSYLDGGIRVFAVDAATGRRVHETRLDTWARTRVDAQGKPFVPAYQMEGALSDVLVSQDDFIYLAQVKFDRNLVEQEVPYILPDPDHKTATMDLVNQPFVTDDAKLGADYETRQRQWLERTQPELLTRLRKTYGSYNLGDRKIGLHVFATSGFLDDSWFNRTYWMYSATWPGFYLAHRAAKSGQLLVVGPEKTYAVESFPARNFQSPLFTPGDRGYLLTADANDSEPVLSDETRGTPKGWGFTRSKPPEWFHWVPIRIRAMVLAGAGSDGVRSDRIHAVSPGGQRVGPSQSGRQGKPDKSGYYERVLFVAGPPDVVETDDPMASFEGRMGAVLRAVSAADGTTLAEVKLDAPPVFDGLIAAKDRLFMATTDGRVLCLGRP